MSEIYYPKYQFIVNDEQYQKFFANKAPHTQLRYIAATSNDGQDSFIYVAPNKKRNHSLLTLYDFFKKEPSNKIIGGKKRNLMHMAQEGWFKKTGHRTRDISRNSIQQLGFPIPVPNSLPGVIEDHNKNPILILDFFHRNEMEPMEYANKTVPLIWVHNDFHARIFEEITIVKDQEKSHPQKEIFYRHQEWLNSQAAEVNMVKV